MEKSGIIPGSRSYTTVLLLVWTSERGHILTFPSCFFMASLDIACAFERSIRVLMTHRQWRMMCINGKKKLESFVISMFLIVASYLVATVVWWFKLGIFLLELARYLTRITREWAQAVWALGFVLILRDLIRGIKDGQSTLTKTDSSRTSRFHHDIIHKYDVTFTQWRLTSSTKSSHIIPQGPHHHQELFESSSRGLQWDFCWNPLRSFQDLGFKNSFEPRLVHL